MAITDTLSRIQIPHAGICFHPSVFIMRANVSLECSYWSCIKSHCYILIQRRARWGTKTGDQMSGWQHAALSKAALSIRIDREKEGRYFSRTPTVWHFRKAVLSILSLSIVAHKEHRYLDWSNLSYGLRAQQRQWAGSPLGEQKGGGLFIIFISCYFTIHMPRVWEGALSILLISHFDILKASLSNLVSG